ILGVDERRLESITRHAVGGRNLGNGLALLLRLTERLDGDANLLGRRRFEVGAREASATGPAAPGATAFEEAEAGEAAGRVLGARRLVGCYLALGLQLVDQLVPGVLFRCLELIQADTELVGQELLVLGGVLWRVGRRCCPADAKDGVGDYS